MSRNGDGVSSHMGFPFNLHCVVLVQIANHIRVLLIPFVFLTNMRRFHERRQS
jgi:hypothetical protein